jgi:hypothetical protein
VRGRFLEHAVRADQSLVPGLWTEQPSLVHQRHDAGQELVEVLDGHGGGRFFVDAHHHCLAAVVGMAAQSGQVVTHAALGGIETVLKAKALGIVGVARVGQVLQNIGPAPTLVDLPAQEQKHGHWVEGYLAAG